MRRKGLGIKGDNMDSNEPEALIPASQSRLLVGVGFPVFRHEDVESKYCYG